MIRAILCEGETDAILLGYYLNKTAGWTYKNKSSIIKHDFDPQDNKCLLSYKNNSGDELIICGVGGKDSFRSFFDTYLFEIIRLSQNEETEFKIAIVTDRDNSTIQEVECNVSEQLSSAITEIKNDCWTRNVFLNSFEQEAVIDALLVTIPKEKEGALENLLMDSLSENEYDANVVSKCKAFVADSVSEIDKYVSTERLKIKSQLGVVLSIMNPDRVFSLFNEYIESVRWEDSVVLSECFYKLIEI